MKTAAVGDRRATAVGKRQRRYQLVTQQLIADLRQVIETADMLPTQLQRAKIAAARNDIPALQPTVAVEKKCASAW